MKTTDFTHLQLHNLKEDNVGNSSKDIHLGMIPKRDQEKGKEKEAVSLACLMGEDIEILVSSKDICIYAVPQGICSGFERWNEGNL